MKCNDQRASRAAYLESRKSKMVGKLPLAWCSQATKPGRHVPPKLLRLVASSMPLIVRDDCYHRITVKISRDIRNLSSGSRSVVNIYQKNISAMENSARQIFDRSHIAVHALSQDTVPP